MNNTTSDSDTKAFTAVIARQFDNPAEAMAWLMCKTVEQMTSEDKDLSGFGMLCTLPWQEIVKRLDPEKKMKPPELDLFKAMMSAMHPDVDGPSKPSDPTDTNRLN